MPLVVTKLETDLKALYNNVSEDENDKAGDDFAGKLAEIIDKYIKSATVTTNVETVVSGALGAGTGKGTCKGTLS